MPDAITDKVDLIKPEIGASNNTWGNKLNEDMDKLETWLVADRTAILAGLQSGRAAEGTMITNLDGDPVELNHADMRTATKPLYYAEAVDLTGSTVTPGSSGYEPGTLADIDFVYRMIDSLLPIGTIIAWYGLASSIPAGWALCNGLSYGTPSVQTPDLRGRFIMAAYDPAASGTGLGDAYYPGGINDTPRNFNHSHTLTIGNHVLTRFEIPPHTHDATGTGSNGTFVGRSSNGTWSLTTQAGGPIANAAMDGGTVGAAGNGTGNAAAHSHENSSVGSVTTPGVPWIALCYIMKVKKFAG